MRACVCFVCVFLSGVEGAKHAADISDNKVPTKRKEKVH